MTVRWIYLLKTSNVWQMIDFIWPLFLHHLSKSICILLWLVILTRKAQVCDCHCASEQARFWQYCYVAIPSSVRPRSWLSFTCKCPESRNIWMHRWCLYFSSVSLLRCLHCWGLLYCVAQETAQSRFRASWLNVQKQMPIASCIRQNFVAIMMLRMLTYLILGSTPRNRLEQW